MNIIYGEDAEAKIARIISGGTNALHVVADFDDTLTRAFHNGKRTHSSFAQLRKGKYLGEQYVKESTALFEHYHPIECDTTIPLAQKNQLMHEWWKKHEVLLVRYCLDKEMFNQIAQEEHLHLRTGVVEIMHLLQHYAVPLLIFSAGLGQIIESFLRHRNLMTPNVHIISNFYTFDSAGKALGYTGPVIHSHNKNEIVIPHFPYAKEIASRKHVILLGDKLADCGMAEGMSHECVLKIGFLNEPDTKTRQTYAEAYDIVICGDGDALVIVDLLKKLTA